MQQRLKPTGRSAGAEVVATELFLKLFDAVNNAIAALHMCFGCESLAALTGALESKGRFRGRIAVSYVTSWSP